MNSFLNSIAKSMSHETKNARKINFKSYSKKVSATYIILYFSYNLLNKIFKKGKIGYRFYRYANDFVVLCSSLSLLIILKKKITTLVQKCGPKIKSQKKSITLLKLNISFDFLGYTFIYLIRTKYIRSKLVHRNKFEYILNRRVRLFVYSSKKSVTFFKTCLKYKIKHNQNLSAYKLITFLNSRTKS